MIVSAKITGTNFDPAIYHVMPRAKRGATDYPMSYSALKDFARCPARWLRGHKSPESPAKVWGGLLDCLVLTPERFANSYAVKPDTYTSDKGEEKPWNGNATVCREWKERMEASGIEIVSSDLVCEIQGAKDRIASDAKLAEYIAGSDHQVALEGVWEDKATGINVPMRSMVDLIPRFESPFAQSAGDLKSSRCADPNIFKRFAYQMNYHVQGALYLAMINAALGESRNAWHWLVVESFPPFESCGIMASPDLLSLGHQTLERMMAGYCKCLKSGVFPGYTTAQMVDGWAVAEPDQWMLNQEFFASEVEIEGEEKELPF